MGRVLRPGPASLQGLGWLARVGPSPLDPWRLAMGWSEVAARSHARRLEAAGWLARYPMTRGDGSLFVATRTGVRVLGLSLRAAGPPAPTWWAHHCGCAWMAAYLHVRERRFLGDRELLDDPKWSGRVSWTDGKGHHTAHHRPDVVGFLPDGAAVAFEVELAQKSLARLQAILRLHSEWTTARRTCGVIYACGDQEGVERIARAAKTAFFAGWDHLAVWRLDEKRQQAIEVGESQRVARASRSASRTASETDS